MTPPRLRRPPASRTTRQRTAATPRVGLIGHGYWGRNLTRVFAQLGALGGVCDHDARRLRAVQADWPEIPTTTSVDDLLSRPEIQAVVIAAPAVGHFQLAWQSLKVGKDVFVEKPLALTVHDGRQLMELARQRRRILMVGHILEYHPAVLKLKSLIQTGQLGQIQYLYSHRLNLGKIRREENILWSFAPHDISAMLFLLDEQPSRVACQGATFLQRAVADVTITSLAFPSGVQGHIFVSWLHPFKEQKLVVVGDRKMAVFDDTAPAASKLIVYPHHIIWRDRVPIAHKAAGEPVKIADAEPLVEECRHFLECIRTRQEPRTNGDDGLRVLEILQRCQESLQTWER